MDPQHFREMVGAVLTHADYSGSTLTLVLKYRGQVVTITHDTSTGKSGSTFEQRKTAKQSASA